MGCSWSAKIKADVETALQCAVCDSSNIIQYKRQNSKSEEEILQFSHLKNFTYNDLRIATSNFCPNSVVGEGGFGCVYKGWIDTHTLAPVKPGSGIAVAVKRLNHEGFQGHKEWLAEIKYLGQVEHRNLVKLMGYCLENEQRVLVYEFMPGGSLDNHLFIRSSHLKTLSWNLRMRIALDAAKALALLHSPKMNVIYRDFKSSNILLDADFNAKLCDFGLAKDGPLGEESYISTEIMGTEGYAAPEYMATGRLTFKSDVYSFGVVLLEIMTGRRVLDSDRTLKEENLVHWARPYLQRDKVLTIMDPRVQGQYSYNSAQIVGLLVMQCLSIDPKSRPNMDEVVSILEQLQGRSEIGELYCMKGEIKCTLYDYQEKISHGHIIKKSAIASDFVIAVGRLCEPF